MPLASFTHGTPGARAISEFTGWLDARPWEITALASAVSIVVHTSLAWHQKTRAGTDGFRLYTVSSAAPKDTAKRSHQIDTAV